MRLVDRFMKFSPLAKDADPPNFVSSYHKSRVIYLSGIIVNGDIARLYVRSFDLIVSVMNEDFFDLFRILNRRSTRCES